VQPSYGPVPQLLGTHWRCVKLGYYSSSDMPSITSIVDNVEDAVFGRILNNPQQCRLLQAYLDQRPQLCYNLRKRTGNYKTLIEKTADLNRDFLIRNLYKYSYWLHLTHLLLCILCFFIYSFLCFYFLYCSAIHVIKLRMSTYNKRKWWWWSWWSTLLVVLFVFYGMLVALLFVWCIK